MPKVASVAGGVAGVVVAIAARARRALLNALSHLRPKKH
jgi:hypothetical protein